MAAPSISAPPSATTRQHGWRAYTALAIGVFCIGWSAIFVKWADVPGPASAFYRAFIATLVLAPFALLRARQRATTPRDRAVSTERPAGKSATLTRPVLALAVLAGLFFAFDVAMYNTSILLTTATNATLLGNNAPLVVALAAWLLFAKRPSALYWAGLAIAMLGTIAIVGFDMIRHPTFGIGDLLATLASVCFAGYLVTIEQIRARSAVDTLTLTTITVAVTAAAVLVMALVMRSPLSGYSIPAWASLIGLGLICQVGGYLALTYALGHLPATLTSVGLLLQAPLTALLAIPLLHESLSLVQFGGGALVLGGVYLVNRSDT